jgi:hypothetical protein
MKSVMARRNMVTKMPSTMPMAIAADMERLGVFWRVGEKDAGDAEVGDELV